VNFLNEIIEEVVENNERNTVAQTFLRTVRNASDLRGSGSGYHIEFAFENLSDLANRFERNPLILSYIDEVEYYKTAYYLGAALFIQNRRSAMQIWTFLSNQPAAGEWQMRAATQLRNPQMEPIIHRL